MVAGVVGVGRGAGPQQRGVARRGGRGVKVKDVPSVLWWTVRSCMHPERLAQQQQHDLPITS